MSFEGRRRFSLGIESVDGPPEHRQSRLIVALVLGRADDEPAFELALADSLLGAVSRGERGPTLRCYRPAPTLAFGRQDTFLPGFAAAAAAARRHGFDPVVRAAGGHAAAYDEGSLVLDEIMPAEQWLEGIEGRFAAEAERLAGALRGLGVDARIGELPGEYCPGPFSVNARGAVKLAGSAQRLRRGAWLFSTVAIVEGAGRLAPVLDDVYGALGLGWDPATVGAIADEAPGTTVEAVRDALLAAHPGYELVPATLAPNELDAARRQLPRHRVD